MTGKIDLHLHSTESDGRLRPADLVALCHRNGVARIALTDHDTTSGVEEALEAGRRLGVEVFPGIELSADVQGAEVHMLGLFLDYQDQDLQRTLADLRDGRVLRARKMVERLAELGAPVSWERVRELAGGASVGRPHLAQAMVEAGHVQSEPEAFDRYLADDRPAYVGRVRLSPEECVELCHRVRGLAVLAHPVESEGSLITLDRLVAAGLDGIECYYQGYDRERVEELVSICGRHGLVATGGSDFHGFPMSGMTEPSNEPGSVDIPPGVVDELLERRRQLFGG